MVPNFKRPLLNSAYTMLVLSGVKIQNLQHPKMLRYALHYSVTAVIWNKKNHETALDKNCRR